MNEKEKKLLIAVYDDGTADFNFENEDVTSAVTALYAALRRYVREADDMRLMLFSLVNAAESKTLSGIVLERLHNLEDKVKKRLEDKTDAIPVKLS